MVERKEWVSVEELRKEGADLSDRDVIDVRFPAGWWCNNPPGTNAHIPAGFERGEGEDPVMKIVGGFYAKYNPSDERTVYPFPATWLSRLPKTARVNMQGTWAAKREAIRAKREAPQQPMTYQEMREAGQVPGGVEGVGTSATGTSLLADKEELEKQIEAEVERRLEAKESEKKEAARARMAKARAAKSKKSKE